MYIEAFIISLLLTYSLMVTIHLVTYVKEVRALRLELNRIYSDLYSEAYQIMEKESRKEKENG